MKIIDLTPQYDHLYHLCLEDWSPEMKEAGDHKTRWHQAMQEKGLRVKLALDQNDEVAGMIQYLPIENSFAEGKQLYIVLCIWVHGHKEGRGNFQKRGFGKALLQAVENDVKNLGANGLVVWGISLPFWMKASWFKKQGYQKADKDGIRVLLWKPFADDALPPKWIREKKHPSVIPGRVSITAFMNGWCPAQNLLFERARRAARELGEKVVFQEINTLHRENFLEWGISDGVFVEGKALRSGPPLKYEKVKKIISHKLKKLQN
jgi:GNAT superfamily N-acetyltransferase